MGQIKLADLMHTLTKITLLTSAINLQYIPNTCAVTLQNKYSENDDKTAQQDDSDINDDEAIVVTGKKRGSLITDAIPDQIFNETDIAALGASSLAELIQLIEAEVSSARGRSNEPPVVLLNGRRISGFREIGNYPPEAIARVEVYSEDIALSYGFSADQLLLNFVLKPNVDITAISAGGSSTDQGSGATRTVSSQFIFVNNDERLSFNASISQNNKILESDRDINFIGDRDERAFRTLSPENNDWNLGLSASKNILDGIVATISAAYSENETINLGADL